ncbi:ROK family transcriptional regulator [Lederbergia citrea]|uniref:ROK family transcriptional regulator n=1 Tax=Lederbergia citrea TaxID=2833581 RepID=UPI001BC90CB1|nr:ROK family transcriptional regulator [Lederbergia citrea]MBS4177335.1 ROK family transcriptional regulator [Lederbergia citrea]
MKLTWNQQLIKRENKSVVLQLIQNHSPLSRADIAQQSGLNKGTVSSLVSELIEDKLILETGPGTSSGGRRPVMLKFNEQAGYSIGIDLGVNYIVGILTDLEGNILFQKRHSYTGSSIDVTLDHVKADIEELITNAPPSPYGIIGIGIAVPGIVDQNSALLLAPNLGWKNSSIKKEIEAFFKIQVIIENEANAGAYGEMMFGLGKHVLDLVYISAGIGIGTGIIINGKLFRGSSGFSGEFGHMTINMNGDKCRCGNFGCWELYASEQFLIKNALQSKLIEDKETCVDRLIELADKNEVKAALLLEKTAANLGIGLVNIIHSLNPEKIIIGNKLSSAKAWMETCVQNFVKEHAMTSHQTEVNVQFSNPTFPANALGVAAFSVEHFLKRTLEI